MKSRTQSKFKNADNKQHSKLLVKKQMLPIKLHRKPSNWQRTMRLSSASSEMKTRLSRKKYSLTLQRVQKLGKFQILKKEAQIKGVLVELEDLRNQSMRSTMIFKNILKENELTWEDTAKVLGQFISDELDMNYTHEEISVYQQSSQQQPRFSKKSP